MRHEKPVFYAEMTQLYVPSAGVIEGVHLVAIRPAQGELNEVILDVPAGATVTDVIERKPAALAPAKDASAATNSEAMISLWRFDPGTRRLRRRGRSISWGPDCRTSRRGGPSPVAPA